MTLITESNLSLNFELTDCVSPDAIALKTLISFCLILDISLNEFASLSTNAVFENTYNLSDARALKTYKTRIANVKKNNITLITNLARDLRIEFRKLSASEFSLRAQVFKDLRGAKNWRQIDFCTEYYKTTGATVSQAWVSRMEQLSRLPQQRAYKSPIDQRRRYVSSTEAINCAKTFKVDPGLFLPCLYTSSYSFVTRTDGQTSDLYLKEGPIEKKIASKPKVALPAKGI